MKLSVIIPIYNEEKTLLNLVNKVQSVKLEGVAKELVLINDCSQDRTADILKSITDKNIKIITHEKNQGKGAAIRTGLKKATGDVIIIQDADLEYNPEEYPKLILPIQHGEADVVYGSRLKAIKENLDSMMKLHYFGNVFLTKMTNFLYGSNITDMETCYKVFRKDILKNMTLKARRFDFEPEITAKILKAGYKIKEVPISFVGRGFEEGKKITWRDGIMALYYLLKYRVMN